MVVVNPVNSSVSWEVAVQQLRAQPSQRELVEACFYDDPLSAAAQRYHASSEWQAVRAIVGAAVGPGAKALDVGAGRGISTYALARDGWQVTALEPDASDVVGAGAIRSLMAESKLSVEVAQTWGEQLPFGDGSFQVVHCRQVLHHARDLKQLCREMVRVLAPGGVLIATREHVISRSEDLPAFLDGHPLHRLYGGEHAYRLDDYLGALRGAGLQMQQVLNPYESNINTYPMSMFDIKQRWARKLRLPSPALIPNAALRWMGARSQTPGRLYTFVGRKPQAAR
jgi:2-polyprenyl-3-methyl-5-hydroxy-6-metoxy-1,4-benzoquinol methylase